ncbi:LytTR family DNA-binding domain-containing protein [Aureisphaera galaxeae]|uniref:LytR/AlgR family response regulator transcription factor n=1 Tax=Aureisphaera galaxeae TaxID=1538023 RepID=UPI0023505FEB|nr:LytTR family DNA-binding domain-containing protein [Aureisphaera galaxeae]MDC8002917.1 LytTR family DNA-binding domain-containing protein [Aureisphaera galaxeae]
MTKYLIIDDEHMAHEIIKGYCDTLGNMQLIKHCYDALEALDYLRTNTVDLIFLDLNMPKLKGFDFLRTLPHPPKVIVTTAYQEHALEGYELEIVDYLLKPFSFERFLKAVNKALRVQEQSPAPAQTTEKTDAGHLFLYSDKKYIQLKVEDILYVEAAGNYSKVLLKDRNVMVREKISDMLEKLPPQSFLRVHKSYIVAKEHIHSVEGNRITISDAIIPIGNLYKANVLALLKG